MQTYKKMTKKRDETIFILKTKKRYLEKQLHRQDGKVDTMIAFAWAQFQELFDLYEIE